MQVDKDFEGGLAGLLLAAARNDIEDVKDCAAYVAKRLHGHGATECADRMRRMLGSENFVDGAWTPERWADQRYRIDDEDWIYSVYRTKTSTEPGETLELPPILAPEQRAMIEEIVTVARSRLQQGEPLPTCILAYGTAVQEPLELARYIARQLCIECFVVQFDNPFGSQVGRWAGQLHRLCSFAAKSPCVLVLRSIDNVYDPVCVKDSWRVEELKCIRAKFLKDLSMLGTPTVVVACTNYEMKLDATDWDRFGYWVELNAAEPFPWVLALRSDALGDMDETEKIISSWVAMYE